MHSNNSWGKYSLPSSFDCWVPCLLQDEQNILNHIKSRMYVIIMYMHHQKLFLLHDIISKMNESSDTDAIFHFVTPVVYFSTKNIFLILSIVTNSNGWFVRQIVNCKSVIHRKCVPLSHDMSAGIISSIRFKLCAMLVSFFWWSYLKTAAVFARNVFKLLQLKFWWL